MRTIVVLCHREDTRRTKVLAAELRQQLNLSEYEVWQESLHADAFDSPSTQLRRAIDSAWAVLVLVSEHGVDDQFERLDKEAIQQRVLADGRDFGRIVVKTTDGVPPKFLASWVSVEMAPNEERTTAQQVLDRLKIKPQWAAAMDFTAAARMSAGVGNPAMFRHFKDVAQMLADGKPLTIMIGLYAAVEEADGGACPSQVRTRLLDLIKDEDLRRLLAPLEDAARLGAMPPMLWQDHLATLCLLTGCSRDEIAAAIDTAVVASAGDEQGEPTGLFAAVGRFVAALQAAALPRTAGLPAVTLLTVCPGLRIERALVANACSFERASLMLNNLARPELHLTRYVPATTNTRRASEGSWPGAYMPDQQPLQTNGEVEFVRLVKLFGSRDLGRGVPSGDLAQSYDLLCHLRNLLESFVDAAGRGPYIVLGGGLVTPSIQAAHSMLLRGALEKPERRPQLAIVPAHSESPDPLRQAEAVERLSRLSSMQDSGLGRLQIVPGDPITFLDALADAFHPIGDHKAA